MANWVYGCDICQQVCPYNAKAPAASHPEILADRTPAAPDLLDLLHLRSSDYRRLTEGSATRRATRNMWRRNAAIALGNLWDRFLTGQSRVQPPTGQSTGNLPTVQQVTAALTEAAIDDNPALRAAAANSLGRITLLTLDYRRRDRRGDLTTDS
jgi:epoxyqueuosine reductase QueG